jgi:endonuclease/exonuclease/phosphatase family metal-dependent hydrolase
MAFSFRKLGRRFFVMVNVALCLIFLLSCLQPWLNPEKFWIVGFLSLAFPYLLIVVTAFALFWLMVKRRYMLISAVSLLLAWNQIDVLFNLDSHEFQAPKKEHELRVLSWNIRSFQGITSQNDSKKSNAENIFELIDKLEPDVVCFQEFGQYDSPSVKRDYVAEMKSIGFKHFVQSKDYNRGGPWGFSNGLAIFSKIPFIATKRIAFTSNPESVLYADLPYDGDTVRVFTTHLQSFKFSGTEYRHIEKIKNPKDSLYEASFNIFSKMKRAFRNRGAQADMIRPLLDTCPHPEIMTCDMNDVPSSYAYWQLRGKRQDAFLEKGFGIGRTFLALAPTLRIDYILADHRFEVTQFKIGKQRYSDHLPLVADLKLTKAN